MTDRPVIMISSTARDLPEHRRELLAACLSLDMVPKMMEHLPAVDADAIEASLDLVKRADVYLGVFAYRYGHVPEGHELSITEMEYRCALERKIPRLIFLIHKDHLVTGDDFEAGSGAEKLKALKTELGSQQVVGFFSSPPDLRAKVSESLAMLRDRLRAKSTVGKEPDVAAEAASARPPPSIESNPYKSLSAFREEDADVFFGRDALVRETLAAFYGLIDPSATTGVRLLVVLGPSGSGKSSFARAGLAAQLNRRAADTGSGLRVVTFVPGEHPMASLATTIKATLGGTPSPPERAPHGNEASERFPSPLITLPSTGPRQLVLLIDQFEELYSLCADPLEQNAFVTALLAAASEANGRVSLILTMRSDFLGETQRHSELNTAIARHSVIVPAMSAENLRLAIAEPAERAGHPLDEATVSRLIGETVGHEGVLPLLQFILSRIWIGLVAGEAPEDTVTRLGGVGGALANHAEKLFQNLSEPDRQIARRAFLGMVHLGEGAQDTRRRVPIERLVANDEPAHVREVIDRFAHRDQRLVTLSEDEETPVAEVTHEALFSHWKRLQDWLDEGRNDIRFQRRLEEAVDEWAAHKEAEDRGGYLWRPPLLSLLADYHKAHSADMRTVDVDFFEASVERQKREGDEEKRRQEEKLESQRTRTRFLLALSVVMGAFSLAAMAAFGFFYFATVHGLDPSEARTALMIRYGPKDVPQPEMIEIRPGEGEFSKTFQMGSEEGAEDERPVHPVSMEKPFAIGQYEVTFDEYQSFVGATTGTNDPGDEGWGRDKRPVINVSWDDAQSYVKWLNAVTGKRYRLPTEAEWEYVAGAGSKTKYWWGDDFKKDGKPMANCWGCGGEWDGDRTAPVGRFPANAFGLHDTAGNVYEWVEDCWHDNYDGAPKDSSAWLESGGCGRRVIRGGSWNIIPRYVRSANRDWNYPDDRYNFLGFRLAQDID